MRKNMVSELMLLALAVWQQWNKNRKFSRLDVMTSVQLQTLISSIFTLWVENSGS